MCEYRTKQTGTFDLGLACFVVGATILSPAWILCARSLARDVTFVRVTFQDVLMKSDVGRVAVADINKDGSPDIIAGGYWYEGPTQ